jgi:hypothetical protein
VSLLTAIVTAAVTAVFGVPFRYYQCWLSWSWVGANLGLALYFGLAGGGGGFLAWLIAEAATVQPTGFPAANGILYGLVAGAALRVDISARPQKSAQDHYREAASILTKCLSWTSSALDDVTSRRIERWLMHCPAGDLVDAALRVKAHIDQQPPAIITKSVKNTLFAKLVPAMEMLAKPEDDPEHAEGRHQLVMFCTAYFVKEHLPKT